MLIQTVLVWTPLLSATFRQREVRGIPFLIQGFKLTIPSHNRQKNSKNSSAVNQRKRMNRAEKKRGGSKTFDPYSRHYLF